MNPPDFFYKLPLEKQALYVWTRAWEGRKYAQLNFLATAAVRLEELRYIRNDRFPSLTRIAHDAARDIDRMLTTTPLMEGADVRHHP